MLNIIQFSRASQTRPVQLVWFWFTSILLGILLMISGCGPSKSPSKLQVVCTTNIITDTVRQIAGDHVNIVGLMGPGVDPHLYKASEGDVSRLASADIIFYNGLHLESKMGEILESLSTLKTVVAVSDGIDPAQLIRPSSLEGLYDPHIWFDISLWMSAAKTIYETLIQVDPDHTEAYTRNFEAFTDSLRELDHWVRDEMATIPQSQRILITAHDAFNYFSRAYGVEVRGLQGVNTESEAGTKDVQLLATFIATQRIPAIFVETSISERKLRAVQDAVQTKGWNVVIGGELFSDALGDFGTPEGTYIGMFRHNIHAIVSGLSPNHSAPAASTPVHAKP